MRAHGKRDECCVRPVSRFPELNRAASQTLWVAVPCRSDLSSYQRIEKGKTRRFRGPLLVMRSSRINPLPRGGSTFEATKGQRPGPLMVFRTVLFRGTFDLTAARPPRLRDSVGKLAVSML